MDKHLAIATAALVVALGLTGCSQSPTPASDAAKTEVKEPPKPAEPVTGRSAFFEMYKPARAWAADVMALSLTSGQIPEVKNADGKAAVWTAVFVSPSLRQARTYSYSVAASGNVQKGVTSTPDQAWSGSTKNSQPFHGTDLQINSDEAFKTASAQAASWVSANPGKPVSITLVSASRFPTPVWSITWGNSKGGYQALVSSVTGKAIK